MEGWFQGRKRKRAHLNYFSDEFGLHLVLGRVEEESYAYQCGVREGDIIVYVNGWLITVMDKPQVYSMQYILFFVQTNGLFFTRLPWAFSKLERTLWPWESWRHPTGHTTSLHLLKARLPSGETIILIAFIFTTFPMGLNLIQLSHKSKTSSLTGTWSGSIES